MTAEYRTARDRLTGMLEYANTEDTDPVELRFVLSEEQLADPDITPSLGVIPVGELVALAEHRCDLAALRAEVVAMRDHWLSVNDHAGKGLRVQTLTEVLDLIDKHAREGQ